MHARRETEPTELIPLSPQVFHILLALADGERHGYAIMQEAESRSGGLVRLGPGTLYGAIRRLLDQGVVEESEERPAPDADDARRRYYRLTLLGRRVLAVEAERLAGLVRAVRASRVVPRVKPS